MVRRRRDRPGDHLSPGGPLALLARRRGFRNLTAALALSYIGSGAGLTALVLYVQSSEGTGVAVGALLLAQTVPRLLGPLAGAFADRSDLRRLMVGADLGGAAIFALLALLPPFGLILGLAALASVLQAAYSPARGAMIAGLVEPDEVPAAYAIENTAFNLQVAIGPVIGGALVAAGGARLALAVDAATFVAAALFIAAIGRGPPRRDAGRGSSLITETREGVAYAMGEPVPRALVLTLLVAVAFLALDNVALPFLIRGTLGGGPADYGLAFGAFGIGMLAGSLALALRPGRSPSAVYLSGLAISGGGAIATGLSPAVGAAIALQGAAGVGNGLENVANNTLIQRHVPARMLGRVFGLAGSAAYAGQGIAALLGGFYVDLTSPRTAFITGGIGGLGALALALRPLRAAGAARAGDSIARPRTGGR